ncbi:hypothetical protein FRAAL3104 [Frankia alni ACN14a]|uniref:Uncharacterized protein n=1 Tax=Frankia alni (strain DSM 45986 / CECT 9034 / ACN14a) TaxID=326424 RepID=Q0RL57_FRAAA|nr:hypothetical protein FRAAL3104 [Frankia alni ACN14a]
MIGGVREGVNPDPKLVISIFGGVVPRITPWHRTTRPAHSRHTARRRAQPPVRRLPCPIYPSG